MGRDFDDLSGPLADEAGGVGRPLGAETQASPSMASTATHPLASNVPVILIVRDQCIPHHHAAKNAVRFNMAMLPRHFVHAPKPRPRPRAVGMGFGARAAGDGGEGGRDRLSIGSAVFREGRENAEGSRGIWRWAGEHAAADLIR